MSVPREHNTHSGGTVNTSMLATVKTIQDFQNDLQEASNNGSVTSVKDVKMVLNQTLSKTLPKFNLSASERKTVRTALNQ